MDLDEFVALVLLVVFAVMVAGALAFVVSPGMHGLVWSP